ncbi:MAG: excisionase [Endomicrobiaceae bacterium]|jgi:hypothetical protein|nr:excisionase [Endomicrobiaceae bacterium]
MDRVKLPYNQRLCISVEEAAEYSMIGENRLRNIIDKDKYEKSLNWILHTGQHVRIKRQLFEKWIEQQDYL